MNNNLSMSNQILTCTVAGISGGPKHSMASRISNSSLLRQGYSTTQPQNATETVSVHPTQENTSNASMVSSIPGISFDVVGDDLQRCMLSVQELVESIKSALSVWQGNEKIHGSDIFGSYAKVTAAIASLPTEMQCLQCSGRVRWSEFDPPRSVEGRCGACVCPKRPASLSSWESFRYVSSNAVVVADERRNLSAPGQDQAPAISVNPTSAGTNATSFPEKHLERRVSTKPCVSKSPFSGMSPSSSVGCQNTPSESEGAGHKVQHMLRQPECPQTPDGRYYCDFALECARFFFDQEYQWRLILTI